MEETTNTPQLTSALNRFQMCASTFLGALIGLLISLPLALPSGYGAILIPPLIGLGGLVGYRRRQSRAFLYFSFVAILLLASLVSESLLVPPTAPEDTQKQSSLQ